MASGTSVVLVSVSLGGIQELFVPQPVAAAAADACPMLSSCTVNVPVGGDEERPFPLPVVVSKAFHLAGRCCRLSLHPLYAKDTSSDPPKCQMVKLAARQHAKRFGVVADFRGILR